VQDLLRFTWSLVGLLVAIVLAPYALRVLEPHRPAALRFWARVRRPVLVATTASVALLGVSLAVSAFMEHRRHEAALARINRMPSGPPSELDKLAAERARGDFWDAQAEAIRRERESNRQPLGPSQP
jgi:hypothetical protein